MYVCIRVCRDEYEVNYEELVQLVTAALQVNIVSGSRITDVGFGGMYVCKYACLYVFIYVCMYLCIYVCM